MVLGKKMKKKPDITSMYQYVSLLVTHKVQSEIIATQDKTYKNYLRLIGFYSKLIYK